MTTRLQIQSLVRRVRPRPHAAIVLRWRGAGSLPDVTTREVHAHLIVELEKRFPDTEFDIAEPTPEPIEVIYQ